MSARAVNHPPAAPSRQSTGESADQLLGLLRATGPVESVPIRSLLPADSPRLAGEQPEHAVALAEVDGALPPILVHRGTMRVIDGMHRLLAARLRGQDSIDAQFFDGNEELGFALAVRSNVAHGLPLSLADREAAAARILAGAQHWSDRAVATITGLSPRTVAAIRRRAAVGAHPPHHQSRARLGKDGRLRPVDLAAGRRRASEALAAHPDASLREIAKAAGVSPNTVRDVRERLRRGDDPLPSRLREDGGDSGGDRDGDHRTEGARRAPIRAERKPDPGRAAAMARDADANDATARSDAVEAVTSQAGAAQAGAAADSVNKGTANKDSAKDPHHILPSLRRDPSIRLSEGGRELLRWLDAQTRAAAGWERFLETVPEHCADAVAVVANACAQEWLEFARHLEKRSRGADLAWRRAQDVQVNRMRG